MRAALAKLPEATREAIGFANETTAQQIVKGAKARVSVRTGDLKKAIAYSFNRKTGTAKVGIARGPIFYGHFLEYGTVRQPARPFMRPAVEAERSAHEGRMKDAGQKLERDLSVSRFL